MSDASHALSTCISNVKGTVWCTGADSSSIHGYMLILAESCIHWTQIHVYTHGSLSDDRNGLGESRPTVLPTAQRVRAVRPRKMNFNDKDACQLHLWQKAVFQSELPEGGRQACDAYRTLLLTLSAQLAAVRSRCVGAFSLRPRRNATGLELLEKRAQWKATLLHNRQCVRAERSSGTFHFMSTM